MIQFAFRSLLDAKTPISLIVRSVAAIVLPHSEGQILASLFIFAVKVAL
jgi:hypothetical protein